MNAKDAAAALGLPLLSKAPDALLLGGGEFSANIELVDIGDSVGFAGAPMHIDGQAYSPMVVVRLWDEPLLIIDPSQTDLDDIKNLITPLTQKCVALMERAEKVVDPQPQVAPQPQAPAPRR